MNGRGFQEEAVLVAVKQFETVERPADDGDSAAHRARRDRSISNRAVEMQNSPTEEPAVRVKELRASCASSTTSWISYAFEDQGSPFLSSTGAGRWYAMAGGLFVFMILVGVRIFGITTIRWSSLPEAMQCRPRRPGELSLGLWLLVVGVNVERWKEQSGAAAFILA